MVGAVFTFLILTFVVFAIIQILFYMTVRGLARAGAERALSLASVIPGLDRTSLTAPSTAELAAEAAARLEVEKKAAEFVTQQFASSVPGSMAKVAGTHLVLPDDPIDPVWNPRPLDVALQRHAGLVQYPMHLIVRLEFRSLVPLVPPMNLDVHAVAYREIQNAAPLPISFDCLGRPLGDPSVGTLPSANECLCFAKTGSRATPAPPGGADSAFRFIYQADLCEWQCRPPLVPTGNGNCTCPDCPAPQIPVEQDSCHIPLGGRLW